MMMMMMTAVLLSAKFSLVNFAGRRCREEDGRTDITSHAINSVLFCLTNSERHSVMLPRELVRLLFQAVDVTTDI